MYLIILYSFPACSITTNNTVLCYICVVTVHGRYKNSPGCVKYYWLRVGQRCSGKKQATQFPPAVTIRASSLQTAGCKPSTQHSSSCLHTGHLWIWPAGSVKTGSQQTEMTGNGTLIWVLRKSGTLSDLQTTFCCLSLTCGKSLSLNLR